MRKAITILAMVCVPLSTVSLHAAQSTFDVDAEGWSMMSLWTFGHPPTGFPGSRFWWESDTGNPGGCIRLTEYGGPNDTFKAPAEYLGDKSSAFDTDLAFDLWISRGGEHVSVALVGNSTTLYYYTTPESGPWNHFQIPLIGLGWKRNSYLGPDATDTDMLDVLGNVLALYIWGDFTSYADEYSRLDNVFMAEAPVARCVDIDIKPQSCPNPLNTKSQGVLPVAILGTPDFDVTQIDPASISLGRDGVDGTVSPLRWAYEDVGTPFEGELCDCHEMGPDGFLDLTLKFSTPEIVETLKLDEVVGETLALTVTGTLRSGQALRGKDCARIQ